MCGFDLILGEKMHDNVPILAMFGVIFDFSILCPKFSYRILSYLFG